MRQKPWKAREDCDKNQGVGVGESCDYVAAYREKGSGEEKRRKRGRKERRRRIGGVRRKDRGEVLLIHVCRKKRGRWCVFGEEGWFFELKK